MSGAEEPSWKSLYQAALLELDPVRFPQLVAEAQKAIENRLEQLIVGDAAYEEFHALRDAQNNLRAISKLK